MNTVLLLMVEGTMIQDPQNHGQMSLAVSIALFGYDGAFSDMLSSYGLIIALIGPQRLFPLSSSLLTDGLLYSRLLREDQD
jgi:hypothetical protein